MIYRREPLQLPVGAAAMRQQLATRGSSGVSQLLGMLQQLPVGAAATWQQLGTRGSSGASQCLGMGQQMQYHWHYAALLSSTRSQTLSSLHASVPLSVCQHSSSTKSANLTTSKKKSGS
jgi:hypothetical protein